MNQLRKYMNIIEGVFDRQFRILKIHNDKDINDSGTSNCGPVLTSYSKLVETFGEPTFVDEDNSQNWTVMWLLKFETQHLDYDNNVIKEDIIATIYDWNYFETEDTEEIMWTVGGFREDNPAHVVEEALNPPHPIRYFEE